MNCVSETDQPATKRILPVRLPSGLQLRGRYKIRSEGTPGAGVFARDNSGIPALPGLRPYNVFGVYARGL
jgi:hypothetical protein